MEENVLRIVQLALAINQAKQERIQCEAHIHEDGDITLKVIEHMEMYSMVQKFGKGKLYYPNQLVSCHFPANVNDDFSNEIIQKLETICHNLGINTNERYMKVEVCP